jgi:hypothetical protein
MRTVAIATLPHKHTSQRLALREPRSCELRISLIANRVLPNPHNTSPSQRLTCRLPAAPLMSALLSPLSLPAAIIPIAAAHVITKCKNTNM